MSLCPVHVLAGRLHYRWLLHTQQKFSISSHVARFLYIAFICTNSGLILCLLSFHIMLHYSGTVPHRQTVGEAIDYKIRRQEGREVSNVPTQVLADGRRLARTSGRTKPAPRAPTAHNPARWWAAKKTQAAPDAPEPGARCAHRKPSRRTLWRVAPKGNYFI